MATDTNATMGTCGIVLASTDPEELTRWYRSALEPLGARWDEHMLVLGGMYLGFDSRDDIAASPAEPGRVLLNVTVRDIRAAERHLNSLGVRWIRPVEDFDTGKICTIQDPDGNYLQILEFPEMG